MTVKATVLNAGTPSCRFVYTPIRFGRRTDGGGCFPAGTKIKMADGTLKNVETLKRGELLFHPSIPQGVHIKQMVNGPEKENLLRISTADFSLTVTKNHPMILENNEFVKARQLAVGDRILLADGAHGRVTRIDEEPDSKDTFVYNIELMMPDSFYAQRRISTEHFATGDYVIQQTLVKEE